jgi:hypothetical protein
MRIRRMSPRSSPCSRKISRVTWAIPLYMKGSSFLAFQMHWHKLCPLTHLLLPSALGLTLSLVSTMMSRTHHSHDDLNRHSRPRSHFARCRPSGLHRSTFPCDLIVPIAPLSCFNSLQPRLRKLLVKNRLTVNDFRTICRRFPVL